MISHPAPDVGPGRKGSYSRASRSKGFADMTGYLLHGSLWTSCYYHCSLESTVLQLVLRLHPASCNEHLHHRVNFGYCAVRGESGSLDCASADGTDRPKDLVSSRLLPMLTSTGAVDSGAPLLTSA